VKLKELKDQPLKQKPTGLLVCSECLDQDHPQLMLGSFPVEDPQALRNPRKDTTYIAGGPNISGFPTSGSRDTQWGWSPVGGSRQNTPTPNNLVARTAVGNVTIET
jgi:hypothetical protein